jgi:hypothetical protein
MKTVRNGVVLSERAIHPVYSGSAHGADLACRFEKVAWPL